MAGPGPDLTYCRNSDPASPAPTSRQIFGDEDFFQLNMKTWAFFIVKLILQIMMISRAVSHYSQVSGIVV